MEDKMMKIRVFQILTSLLIITSLAAFADGNGRNATPEFPADFSVLGVGNVRLDFHYTGEPASPGKAVLTVKCDHTRVWKPVASIETGDKPTYTYDIRGRILTLTFHTCRVIDAQGRTICDQGGAPKQIPLAGVCARGYVPPNFDDEDAMR